MALCTQHGDSSTKHQNVFCAPGQRNGGKLDEREARSVLIGIGPPVPPPRMAGLDQLKPAVPQLVVQVPTPSFIY